jgi:hypothetical protein
MRLVCDPKKLLGVTTVRPDVVSEPTLMVS